MKLWWRSTDFTHDGIRTQNLWIKSPVRYSIVLQGMKYKQKMYVLTQVFIQ